MYQREVPGGGRDLTPSRKSYLLASGEMVVSPSQRQAISASNVPAGWQPQLTTAVDVEVAQKSPTTNCLSVGRSNLVSVSDAHYRTETSPRMLSTSHRRVLDLTGHDCYIQNQSASVTPCYRSAAGQPAVTIQRNSDIRSSLQQMMVNRRSVQGRVLPPASNRESVLQQLTDELQQQKWRMSNMYSCLGSSKLSVVRPVPVKAERAVQQFHPLMSSPSHLSCATVVSSSAQISSGQAASYGTLRNGSSEAMMKSTGSAQRNLQDTPVTPSYNTELYRAELASRSQSVSVPQSVQFGSQDRSPVGRWYPSSAASVEVPLFSPSRSASGRTYVEEKELDPSWPVAHCSRVQSYQSQNYSSGSRQHGAVSLQNYGPVLCLPTSQTPIRSLDIQSAKITSPHRVFPRQDASFNSPAELAASAYPLQQGFFAPHSPESHFTQQPHSSVSDKQMTNVSSACRMSSDMHHRLGSVIPSHSSQDLKPVESPRQHAVSLPSSVISPTKVGFSPVMEKCISISF